MVDPRKDYLIRIFLKKCTVQNINKKYLDFYFKLCNNTYNITEEKIKELKDKFTPEEYIKRVIPIIDKHFTIEELKGIMKFYSSKSGMKLLDAIISKDIDDVGKNMFAQIEQEFSLNSKKG